jgi:acetoacetate decarboxylase
VITLEHHFTTPLGSPLFPKAPYHYKDARLFLALFNPTETSLEKMLRAPLRPSQMPLAGLMFGEQKCVETGTFMEAALLVQCMFDNAHTKEEEVGVYFAYNYVDSDVAQSAGREIWGYPRKQADIKLTVKGNTVEGTVVRDGITLLKASCKLEDDGEWIDSGPNINFKVIPNVTGTGYDVTQITAGYLTYDIKSGKSGEVEFEIRSGPRDDFSPVEIESPMLGLYFDCDITVPPGKVVGEVKL